MKISTKQYVKAIFELQKDDLDKMIEDLENANSNVLELKNLLENPNYSLSEKRKTLSEKNITDRTINLLFVLTKNHSINKIRNISRGLKDLRNKKTGSVEIEITSAYDLTKEYINKLKSSLEEKLNKKVILSVKIDKNLLGGIVLKMGDEMIDNSFKNKLNIMKHELIK